MATGTSSASTQLENVASEEAEQIASIVKATEAQLRFRYGNKRPFLRGVHPKAHGCVEATFTVMEKLGEKYRVGLFAQPGRQYRADIRFSNAAPLVTPDSPEDPPQSGKRGHGSRGMAVKLHGVGGKRLVPDDGEDTQDFLMINQPVFAFANVEDYEVLSRVVAEDKEDPRRFFGRLASTNEKVRTRAEVTKKIIDRIKSLSLPDAFAAPPLSPLDNRYFTAAPFLFGEGHVAKFSANPAAPVEGELGDAIAEKDYLRAALNKRLAVTGGDDIVFYFEVQRRPIDANLNIDDDIENACTFWDEKKYPFEKVAMITIRPQDINAREEACERLEFSPWHGLVEHRPLGSINRMRRTVYEKSWELRRCPVSTAPASSG
jgi:catalase